MIEELKELWRFRELLISMVQRELRIRYKNSFFGFLWSFANPLATTAVMYVVFGLILGIGVKNYGAYILSAYLPFVFLQSSILDSSQSVLTALPIVKKIYFPREILPLASVISNFIHLLSGLGVLFIYLLIAYLRDPRVVPFQASTIYLPILLVITFALAAGMALLVSALNTFYEDVKYLMTVVLYLGLFLCPVMYFVEVVASSSINKPPHYFWYKVYNLNPFAALCIAYRKTLLAPTQVPFAGKKLGPIPLEWNYIAACALISFGFLVFGYWVFNRLKWRFVERP